MLPGAENHESQAPSIPHSEAKPAKPRTRNHLNRAGQSILEDYLRENPNVMPRLDVRNSLLLQIKHCGNEFYGSTNLNSWFKRHVAVAPQNSFSNEYPSLSKPAMDHLEILMNSTTNPSPDLIRTWATLLEARLEDVVKWLQSRLVNQRTTARLPTPANTVTPEPSLPPSSPRFDGRQDANASIKQSPIASPISLSPRVITSPTALSPNILPSAYPPISRVPGYAPATQISPVASPIQVNHDTLTYSRQRSMSSNISSVPVASPTSPALQSPPLSATRSEHKYMPFQQWPPPSSAKSESRSTSTSTAMSPSCSSSAPIPPPQTWTPILNPPPAARPSPVRALSPQEIKPKQEENRPNQRDPLLQAIIEGFSKAPANPPPPPEATSIAEYQALFAANEKLLHHMKQLLDK